MESFPTASGITPETISNRGAVLGHSNVARSLPLALFVLVIVAFSLASRADDLSIWPDETWSVFHSSRSVGQILQDPDVGWPYGHFLLLHVWIRATGTTNDFVLHTTGIFLGLLATAFMIRIGRALRLTYAGLFAALAFGTSSYAVYFFLELRGYGLMLLAETAFLWAYFDWLRRPGRGRDAILWTTLVAMLYTHFILGVVIALATGHAALAAPRRFGRWVRVVSLSAVAFLPLAPSFLHAFHLRASLSEGGPLPLYFRQGFDSFLRAYSAHWDIVFACVLMAAAVGIVPAVRTIGWRSALWLVLWAVGLPLAAYFTRESTAYFTPRYLAFTMPAAFLLLSMGLAAFRPRWIAVGLLAVLACAPWRPFDFRPAYTDFPPIRDFMRVLASQHRFGDRLVVDPSLSGLVGSMEWEYYRALYLPQGDPTSSPTYAPSARRIWYVTRLGAGDPALKAGLVRGRVERYGWGPWYLRALLFEGPPGRVPVAFERGLRFLGADFDRGPTVHAGDELKVTLWWSSDRAAPSRATVWLVLRDAAGTIVASAGEPPRTVTTPEELAAWSPETIYVDERLMTIPYKWDDGTYTLELAMAAGADSGVGQDGNRPLILGRFHLSSAANWLDGR